MIEVERVAELGDLSDPVSVILQSYDLVRSLPGGGWIVLQPNISSPVLVYREDGSFDGVSVRQGDGPLELRRPRVLARGPGDSVWITDDRGKFLVLDPQGGPARSVPGRPRMRLHAFSDDGFRASHRFRLLEDTIRVGVATIWSPSGDSVRVMGPGSERDLRAYPSADMSRGQTLVLVADTLAYAAFGDPPHTVWLERWTTTTSEPLVLRREAWEAVDPDGRMEPPDSGLTYLITRGDRGHIWGVAFWTSTPGVEGAVKDLYRSFLWVADDAGRVLAARHLPSLAWGFPDPGHFYTYREEPSGLLVIEIHAQRLRCGDSVTEEMR